MLAQQKEEKMNNRLLAGLVTGIVLLCLTYTASATVLDFEGLTTETSDKIPTPYGGFEWQTMYLLSDKKYMGTYGNTYGSPSGEYAAFNQGKDGVIKKSAVFDFTGAYFTGRAENDAPMWCTAPSLTIEGYNGSTLMYSVSFDLSTDQYDWIQVDFIGITKLTFSTPGYPNYWLMDDFTYNESNPVPEPTPVSLDVKPGSCPNPLNVKSKGVLPVAILGAEDFDVTTIDPASIRLEGVAPLRSSIEDVSQPSNCEDDGGDGYADLTLKFDTQEIVAALGDIEDGEEIVLNLTGTLQDGTQIEGSDTVLIIKKDK